ncbi:DNA sulfur modification protein DndD [Desulfovibrio ferrophilus]|uniref:ATPase involved in DNA repair n=1 Tax=Desulfovibrio ferrophilus TaxID=241368 RepID=A0A2Z6AYU8_9BACT|nr:DNA sulfur modification protein DndD [Desulfovibrio ferrophilus]BBD08437.1 ATPase involved in DNA repair [Desulfovibrio ferrophilus]
MLLKKIILNNYGLYKGKKIFDLTPRMKYNKIRPVVLFGGKNGAGKTTLFDSLRLALYGKNSLGNRVSKQEYLDFLRSRIHRSPSDVVGSSNASVALEFDYVSMGLTDTYFVERSWAIGNGKGILEHLRIEKNGEKLEGVTADFWQGFVEDIIPERLSTLFFFDGEKKIQDIAQDGVGNKALAESIRSLLGLDIVERLKSDLGIYRSREVKKVASQSCVAQLATLESERFSFEEGLSNIIEKLGEVRKDIDMIEGAVRRKESQLHSEGHVFARQRESLIVRKSELATSIEEIQKAIREECEEVFPFSFCPTVAKKLVVQIENEVDQRRLRIVGDELKNIELELLRSLEGFGGEGVQVPAIVSSVIEGRLNAIHSGVESQEFLGLSESESQHVLSWLSAAEKDSRPRMQRLAQRLEEVVRELQKVDREIAKSPSDSVLNPIMEELAGLNQRLGMKEREYHVLEDQKRIIKNKISETNRLYERLVKREQDELAAGERVEMVARIQNGLDEYIDKLTRAKIEELKTTVASCFNSLSRKGDLIREIDIDPETFGVTLLDRYGNSLPKEELSSGEKQMYAVAMLWALTKASGRALPVIIDTPLGRLDSDHRRKLIQNYFPKASEQVIILSTDTEVDQDWYNELSPSISHCYHLKYDSDSNQTIVSNEYFWRG